MFRRKKEPMRNDEKAVDVLIDAAYRQLLEKHPKYKAYSHYSGVHIWTVGQVVEYPTREEKIDAIRRDYPYYNEALTGLNKAAAEKYVNQLLGTEAKE